MPKLSTCKLCGTKLKKEEKYTFNNKTYCKNCYDKLIEESNQYKKLINSICSYFNINKPTGLILKQIKDYRNNFDFEYNWIMYCLWYITYICNKTLDIKFGIAMVKYEYENAKKYYYKQEQIKNSVINKKSKEIVKKVKITKNSNNAKILINLDEVN